MSDNSEKQKTRIVEGFKVDKIPFIIVGSVFGAILFMVIFLTYANGGSIKDLFRKSAD